MCEIFNRLEQICAQKEQTQKEFLIKCGIRKSTWDMSRSRGSKPSIDTIMGVLSAYPEISAEWLLRGKGDMLLSDEEKTQQKQNAGDLATTLNYLSGRCTELEAEIALLKAKKGKLAV